MTRKYELDECTFIYLFFHFDLVPSAFFRYFYEAAGSSWSSPECDGDITVTDELTVKIQRGKK